MNAIATLQQNYIDVDFPKLNDITARLRVAGAKVSVKKLGKMYRIILLQKPFIASVEQVLSYSNNVASIEEKFDETVFTNDLPAIIAANDSSETILLPKEPELASLDELQNLPLAQL